MKFTSIAEAKKLTGLSYLGMVNSSVKHKKNYKYTEMVYALYLSPARTSGYNVCPMSNKECEAMCLNESGRNKMDIKLNKINSARIKKTRLFFEHREFFMEWMLTEINNCIKKAEKNNFHFSVRLNNTSDISPEQFQYDGKNILQLYSTIQFYDYTKVPKRAELVKKYNNYDLTFSYDGYNWDICKKMLDNNIRVAVVFYGKLPKKWNGYKVIDGDLYDTRFLDKKNVIVGLKFKHVRNKPTKDMKFIVQ